MNKSTMLTVEQFGDDLAVKIPTAFARSAHIAAGQTVEVIVADERLTMHTTPSPLSLEQKLALFDPEKHGGELMATNRLGAEA